MRYVFAKEEDGFAKAKVNLDKIRNKKLETATYARMRINRIGDGWCYITMVLD
jgi:hypothetical protein